MIELEKHDRVTAVPVRSHERALPLISVPNVVPDLGRDVAVSRSGPPPAHSIAGPEPPLLNLLDQEIERSSQHLGDITRRKRMAEKSLHITDSVPDLWPDQERHELIDLGGE